MVAISVLDNGSGISPENIKKLFEPLFTTKTKGIGLGLAVSKKLAEANNGRIEVRSEAGKGSKFTVWLPAEIKESMIIDLRTLAFVAGIANFLQVIAVYLQFRVNKKNPGCRVVAGWIQPDRMRIHAFHPT